MLINTQDNTISYLIFKNALQDNTSLVLTIHVRNNNSFSLSLTHHSSTEDDRMGILFKINTEIKFNACVSDFGNENKIKPVSLIGHKHTHDGVYYL